MRNGERKGGREGERLPALAVLAISADSFMHTDTHAATLVAVSAQLLVFARARAAALCVSDCVSVFE